MFKCIVDQWYANLKFNSSLFTAIHNSSIQDGTYTTVGLLLEGEVSSNELIDSFIHNNHEDNR